MIFGMAQGLGMTNRIHDQFLCLSVCLPALLFPHSCAPGRVAQKSGMCVIDRIHSSCMAGTAK